MRESIVWVIGLTVLCFSAIACADAEVQAPAADVIQARWEARNIPFGYG
jgi:hypothetical protein